VSGHLRKISAEKFQRGFFAAAFALLGRIAAVAFLVLLAI
jgi:hypothetical protein